MGELTTNEFFYKPEYRARGIAEKLLFDAGLDKVDTRLSKLLYATDPMFGAIPDDGTDQTPALQAMIDYSVANGGLPMYVPHGTYKLLSDTLKLNKGVDYAGFAFFGAGSSYKTGFGTVIDASAFGDRPGINIQGARRILVADLRVIGKNVAPNIAATTQDPTLANWITAGCNNTQYAPYAGICIDAYQGTKPSGGYGNDDYNRKDSSYVILHNVVVTNFVVGLCINPSTVALDSDAVTATSCQFYNNTFGYSSGCSQSRSIVFLNTDVYGNWCSFTTLRHGNQIGNCPNIYGGILQLAWKLFELGSANGNNAKIISGIHAESFGWLGEFGTADSGGSQPTKFVGCHFTYPGNIYEPYFFIATSPLHFDSCFLDGYNTRQILNYYSIHKVKFTNMSFKQFVDTIQGFIGISDQVSCPFIAEYDNCEVEQIAYTDSGYPVNLSNDFKDHVLFSARRFIAPWTHSVRLWSYYGFTNYKVRLFDRGYYSEGLTISGAVITGVDHNAVLTFTAGNATDWKVGDIIFWQVPDRSGLWTTIKIPAFKVTVAAGTAITATSLVDNVDVTYLPTTVYVCIPLFFNATESTGDTHTNTTIDNVTEITNWKVGDWIQGAGIDYDTRITNIVGTTITLSKATTATASGVALYNCKLTAY